MTVDPERDTAEVLRKYGEGQGANFAGWSFLTGSPAEIQDVTRRYGIFVKKQERGDVDHTFLTSIIDQSGTLRVQYLGVRFDPNEFLRDVRSVLRERPGSMSQVGRSPPVVEQHAASEGAAGSRPPPHGISALFLRLLRKGEWLPRLVARIPATIHVKLLTAFLTIVVLLIVVGAVGLETLSAVNTRTEELVLLHRKIGAYRQLQHDTTGQLYSVASSLMSPDERALDATLRQLNQFGYDLDRLEFVAKDEVELLGRVREDYEKFIKW